MKIFTLIFLILATAASATGYFYIDQKIRMGEKKITAGEKQIAQGEKMLRAGRARLAAGKQELAAGKKKYQTAQAIPLSAAAPSSSVIAYDFRMENVRLLQDIAN